MPRFCHSQSPYDLLASDAQWTIAGNSLGSRTYESKEAFLRDVIRPFNARMRKDADLALAAVQCNLQNATSAPARITGSVRTVRRQNQWLAGAAGLALVLGTMGGAIILPAIDWVVPEGWLWPEKRAMSALRRNGWEAGERLLLVADPERWKAVQASTRLSEENSGAIERCARRAADRKLRSVGCTIEVGARDY